LTKRYCWEASIPFYGGAAGTGFWSYFVGGSWPIGPMPAGSNQSDNTQVPTAYPGTSKRVSQNTLVSYISVPFAGWRGSMRVKLVPFTGKNYTIITSRSQFSGQDITGDVGYVSNRAINDESTIAKNARFKQWMAYYTGFGGLNVSNGSQTIELELPHYTNCLYHALGTNTAAVGIQPFTPTFTWFALSNDYSVTTDVIADNMQVFKAAGDDFNVFGWLGSPDLGTPGKNTGTGVQYPSSLGSTPADGQTAGAVIGFTGDGP